MRRLIVPALLVVVALLASCGDDDDGAPSLDIVGSWNVAGQGEDAVARYAADGTYEIRALDGATEYAFDTGTYTYDGDTLVYTSAVLSRFCRDGQSGTYKVEAVGEDGWSVDVVEEECGMRAQGTPFVHQPQS